MSQRKPEDGVFQLLTDLCRSTASKYSVQSRTPEQGLTAKMRTRAYEILLKKSATVICVREDITGSPIVDLLSYYLSSQKNVRNVSEYKRSVELKKVISAIRQTDYGEDTEHVYSVITLLVGLSDSVKVDHSPELFQNPFTFGLLEEMLPKPPVEPFGSPQPYSFFPSHVFELPYSLKRSQAETEQMLPAYTVESFGSPSLSPDYMSRTNSKTGEIRTFLSPMSLLSLPLSNVSPSPYSATSMWYPRLTAPRDIRIPTVGSENDGVKISFTSTAEMKEVFRPKNEGNLVDIWEMASQLDKDVPQDIWEVVSKLPPVYERQLISTSPREMVLWRRIHADTLMELNIISERQFIRHLMYLIIGIETSSFPFCQKNNCFYMKDGLALEGISKELLQGYVADLLLVGTYYRRLYKFAFNQTLDENFHSNGLVFEASREVIRRYLLDFRLVATEIYDECCRPENEDVNCMPTLLQIRHHMEPLKYEIETIVSIYKLLEPVPQTIPHGAELMSYLSNEISMITHNETSHTMYNSLYAICKVYFKFIERFIFEGELDDRYEEFFVRKDPHYVNTRSKRYWDKGFHIAQSLAVPDFLRALAKFILLCGKSLRLLKHCNPSDPLVVLISSDHPSVKCCASFEELERQQQLLDVYRTRCLFVSGDPVTFDQILLKKEAERKACTEVASLKQAETLEKIVSERKRLAQLIIAEKQHSLRVLEAAIAESKASKMKSKQRANRLTQLQKEAEQAQEEVDSRLRDDERNKIMEYYSKLNMEVEKSKLHTEWKIKRLLLDESRMQLLSTDERNLKREKLELEHKKNEDIMTNMTMSTHERNLNRENVELEHKNNEDVMANMAISIQSFATAKSENTVDTNSVQDTYESAEDILKLNKSTTNSRTSTDVISVICNAAKSIFGRTKSQVENTCDNIKELDFQGNVISIDQDNNPVHTQASKTSSDVIGHDLNDAIDNLEYLNTKEQALKNKEKVMAHEFGQTDSENNLLKDTVIINLPDEENNLQTYLTPFDEAKRNKLKVLGDEFHLVANVRVEKEPKSDAHKEALLNRDKVLGVEYNLPYDEPIKKVPANVAQEEAVRNRDKNMGSEGMRPVQAPKRDILKRSGLKLNLKPYSDCFKVDTHCGLTPNTGAITPGELFPRLDLETPTTADVPFEGAMTYDGFTPDDDKLDQENIKPDKEFLHSDGFDFSIIEEVSQTENLNMQMENSPASSPSKSLYNVVKNTDYKQSVVLLDGSYSLEEFDPFGVKTLVTYNKYHFNRRMDSSTSCYTHPAVIMEEVKKPPYANIFASHFGPDSEDDQKISCHNIATLTACLQRSVMLPLTYQLEVVNNSILTYFLVNLDMYEHMRSLKDYFFLMDGEFSKSICQNIFSRLGKTLNPQELLNYATLHNILDKALGSSISRVHKFSENLSFTITESPLSFLHSSPDCLQCLSLTYSVNWPLNIILSQEALLRYDRVFQFLVKMRRIFWVLSEDFEALKLAVKLAGKQSRMLLKSPHYISVQIYRHVMASMIRALDNYIVTTCILTSWKEFETDLQKARTLDDLYECHVVYIKKVLFRCLLNNRSTPVMKLLNDIFTVILKFSRLLQGGEWYQKEPNGNFTHSHFPQIEEIYHLFDKLANYLHRVVTKLMDCGYQRHLVELLTMVNLNGYYSSAKSKEDTNASMQST